MKITGGKYRGKKINHPGGKMRPTLSKVRQAVFNSLGNDLRGYEWVDLFAGTGIMGMEALSRGADHIYFIDIDKKSLSTIQRILYDMDIDASRYTIRHGNALRMLSRFSRENSLIYLDPPFDFSHLDELVKNVEMHFKGTVIWELPFDNKMEFQYSIKTRVYGNIKIIFERKDEE